MNTWGLVLSGGVAHGIANAGVAEVLYRENLKPDCIAGSSMGAIVGALVAMGHTPEVLRDLALSVRPWEIVELSDAPFKGGLHGGVFRQALHRYLDPLIGDATIADCAIPFVCIAGRLKEQIKWERIMQKGFFTYVDGCVEPYVFPSDTKLIDALIATSAMPVTFSPAKIGNDEFIDLLAFGAIPSRTLRDRFRPDIVIATDTNPHTGDAPWLTFLPPGWREFLEEGEKSLNDSRAACDLVIRPTMEHGPFRFDKAMEFYDAGKQAATDALPRIKALIESA